VERWRSVGLTIATLAGEMVARAEHANATSEPPLPATKPESSAPSERGADVEKDTGAGAGTGRPTPSRRQTLWIGVAGAAGPGLGDGSARFGGWADAGWRPLELPLFLRFSAGFAARPRDLQGLSVQWETVTLGMGGTVGSGPLAIEPRLAASLDVVHAAVTDSASNRGDSGTSVGFGLHGGADVVFRIQHFGVVGSLDAWHLAARTDILVKDAYTGVSSANGWALGMGVRFFLE
jgi:hypothetical protein